MGWVYLDDAFTEHPKVIEAGGDAGWLLVCAISYCNRNVTGGVIPKAKFRTLSDRKNVPKLIHKLLQVGLLHESENGYEIHDYAQWQRSSNEERERRVERAKKAAQARWHPEDSTKDNEMLTINIGDAPGNAQALPEQSKAHAKDMPHARGPHSPHPTTNVSNQPKHLPEQRGQWEGGVFEILADRAVAAEPEPVRNLEAFRASVIAKRKAQFGQLAKELRQANPTWTAQRIADALEPPPPKPRPNVLPRPDCETCEGSSMVLDENGDAMRCPDCSKVGVA